MLMSMLLAKIHRATVTDANLAYEGSITIDSDLLSTAGIPDFAQVHVYNCTNGHRFITYTMPGDPGSGMICINGAAAHLATRGDIIIICQYGLLDDAERVTHQPRILLVDADNAVVSRNF